MITAGQVPSRSYSQATGRMTFAAKSCAISRMFCCSSVSVKSTMGCLGSCRMWLGESPSKASGGLEGTAHLTLQWVGGDHGFHVLPKGGSRPWVRAPISAISADSRSYARRRCASRWSLVSMVGIGGEPDPLTMDHETVPPKQILVGVGDTESADAIALGRV